MVYFTNFQGYMYFRSDILFEKYKKRITFIGYNKSNLDKSVCKKGCGEKKLYS